MDTHAEVAGKLAMEMVARKRGESAEFVERGSLLRIRLEIRKHARETLRVSGFGREKLFACTHENDDNVGGDRMPDGCC
jgi:hypothetical protein